MVGVVMIMLMIVDRVVMDCIKSSTGLRVVKNEIREMEREPDICFPSGRALLGCRGYRSVAPVFAPMNPRSSYEHHRGVAQLARAYGSGP